MRTYLECIPCFVRQALDSSRMVTNDPAVHERVVRDTLRLVAEMPLDCSPPWMGQRIHRLLRDAVGDPDPYREVKQYSHGSAMALYPTLKQRVCTSADPFAAAVRMAVAGNVIDFGCRSRLDNHEVYQAIEDAMDPRAPGLDNGTIDDLRRAIEQAKDILYLTDNAGEIVFDQLLIEEMPTTRITLATRGSPVINDATRADAEAAGLSHLATVMDNGSNAPGTILQSCSSAFQARFATTDLVIAKGQGNYETLNGVQAPVFFLLKVKCPVIARDIGWDVGQALICRTAAVPGEFDKAGSQSQEMTSVG